ncbi:glycosyltransferase family 2 protein [Fibrella forsythiae]|uniref:Glycosyltransferase family 2 protein n=1 Tax=Fibrella forsythiae TaxID=2817061 RepID=A0ABS3JQ31_9BACT|nr:glycosyltransferase family 2 protein [Fibrella forsythiae]MBO0952098.1 glycosyltransferase family 2 protein [Fibrella forsythiae]
MSSLAVVILNYNGRGFLSRFLPAVVDHADGAIIYVADNGSTDGSVALLRGQFPAVQVIELPVNEGYAGGYNTALAHIRDTAPVPFTYYCLLNSDVAVTPGWIRPVLTLLDTHPRVAACQPKLLAYDQPTQFEYAGGAGGYLDWLGFAFCRGRLFDTLETDTGQYNDNRPVFWASGACLFVRASVFHQLGGFDPAFFAHMEEIDWCWRAQRHSHEIWTCGESVVHHVGAGTLAKTNPKKTYLNYRNSLAMLYKNLPGGSPWGLLLLRLMVDGLSAGPLLLRGEWASIWAILRAHFAFYGWLSRSDASGLRGQRSQLAQTATTAVPLFPMSIIWQYFAKGKRRFSEL